MNRTTIVCMCGFCNVRVFGNMCTCIYCVFSIVSFRYIYSVYDFV